MAGLSVNEAGRESDETHRRNVPANCPRRMQRYPRIRKDSAAAAIPAGTTYRSKNCNAAAPAGVSRNSSTRSRLDRPTRKQRNEEPVDRQQDIRRQIVEQVIDSGLVEARDAFERIPAAPYVERKNSGHAGEETAQAGQEGCKAASNAGTPDQQRNHQFEYRNRGAQRGDKEQQKECASRDRTERHLREGDGKRDEYLQTSTSALSWESTSSNRGGGPKGTILGAVPSVAR